MTSPFFGEFMGTLVLCLLGNGNVANVVLKRSKAEGSGWIVRPGRLGTVSKISRWSRRRFS